MWKLQVVKTHPAAQLPVQGSEEAAGYDLCSIQETVITPGETKMIETGIRIQLPKFGMNGGVLVAKVCSRSGLALKKSVFVLNAPGIVDQDYTGPVNVILHNAGKEDFFVKPGDRVAQILFQFVFTPEMEVVETFDREVVRGDKGFGSTGR